MNEVPEKTTPPASDDAALAARARAIFKSACDHADSYHVLRLAVAHRKALDARAAHPAVRVWAPLAGATACCVLVAGVILMRPGARTTPVAHGSTAAVAEGIGGVDEIPDISTNQMDMVQNLDFYQWLATQPAVASAAGGNRH